MHTNFKLHIILFQPEIPQNTGNVGRLCAYTGSTLHLIHPLGFEITDRHLKRSGMDYWNHLDVYHHDDWECFLCSPDRPQRIWLFTTQSELDHWDANFESGDGLLFGNEGNGAPPWLHQWAKGFRLRIPPFSQGLRSLNLSTSVGIATYEAIRTISNGVEWADSYAMH